MQRRSSHAESCRSASSSSVQSTGSNQETWDDWIEDPARACSLFDGKTFASAELALAHDKAAHGVDIGLLASTLDFFERIRLINWIRATKPAARSLVRLDRNAAFLDDDKYLKPVLENDMLLQLDFDSLSTAVAAESSTRPSALIAARGLTESDELQNLRIQLYDSNKALEHLHRVVQNRIGDGVGLASYAEIQNEHLDLREADRKGKQTDVQARDDDSHYFESYAYDEIHEIMLKDKIRTNAYRDFIMNNRDLFKDAVVLDVGCGTGILSMFAAQAGAKKVYAVDASAIAYKAERNIKENGFSEVISVIKGKVEDIELPEKVDFILSEWMGYFLLYECMLDSVLHARRQFLKPGGLMVPSQTSIMLSLFAGGDSLINDRIAFWDDVYGFRMESMKEEMYADALIEIVNNGDVVSDVASLSDIVTQTVTIPELSIATSFILAATSTTRVHAFLGHFDTFFTTDGRVVSAELGVNALQAGKEVFFTTGAHGPATHWKQTVFLLREPIDVIKGTVIAGTLKCHKNPDNSRELVVEMAWCTKTPVSVGAESDDAAGRSTVTHAQMWKVR